MTAVLLRARDRVLDLAGGPLVMGVLNASPDSFSDGGAPRGLEDRLERARELVAQGADLLDIGGESAVTNRPAVEAEEEIERVVPLIERAAAELDVPVSVDTRKPAVARAAIAAGACIVNDVSGLRDPDLATACAQSGAALVLMHTRAQPKQKLHDPAYDDVMADVLGFLRERIVVARDRGVALDRIAVDPGPDFAKTPAQTVEVLRRAGELRALGRPVLWAVSRKDFVGALTTRAPGARLAGTLAAVAHGLDQGAADILRVHDVAAVRDFLTVRAALRGEGEVRPGLALEDALRWEQGAA